MTIDEALENFEACKSRLCANPDCRAGKFLAKEVRRLRRDAVRLDWLMDDLLDRNSLDKAMSAEKSRRREKQ